MDFLNPETFIDRIGLIPGMIVVDFGTGGGQWTLAAARRVGEAGRVYAFDVQRGLLEKLKKEAMELGFKNVEVIWSDLERVGGSKVADNLVDFVIIANLLFQTKSPYFIAKEAARILKPGGRVLVIDWEYNEKTLLGPHPDHILSIHELEQVFIDAGFRSGEKAKAGNHHFALLFDKPIGYN